MIYLRYLIYFRYTIYLIYLIYLGLLAPKKGGNARTITTTTTTGAIKTIEKAIIESANMEVLDNHHTH